MKFVITSLPRSGSQWLANWFTGRASFCFHEPLRLAGRKGPAEVARLMRARPERHVGIADPGFAMWADDFLGEFPGARIIIVRRPLGICTSSYRRKFGDITDAGMEMLNGKLAELQNAYARRTFQVDYERLFDKDAAALRRIHEWIGMDAPDMQRFDMLRRMQVDACLKTITNQDVRDVESALAQVTTQE